MLVFTCYTQFPRKTMSCFRIQTRLCLKCEWAICDHYYESSSTDPLQDRSRVTRRKTNILPAISLVLNSYQSIRSHHVRRCKLLEMDKALKVKRPKKDWLAIQNMITYNGKCVLLLTRTFVARIKPRGKDMLISTIVQNIMDRPALQAKVQKAKVPFACSGGRSMSVKISSLRTLVYILYF